MATSGRGWGVVGYNVQVAVDTKHHLIVTHEVTNVGSDRAQLAHMAKQTKTTLERRISMSSPTAAISAVMDPLQTSSDCSRCKLFLNFLLLRLRLRSHPRRRDQERRPR